MTRKEALRLRAIVEQAAASLPDKEASEGASLFPIIRVYSWRVNIVIDLATIQFFPPPTVFSLRKCSCTGYGFWYNTIPISISDAIP